MFIRVNTTPNSPRKSIQVVENHRVGNTVKQKIVRYVGIAINEHEEQKLKELAAEFIANFKTEKAKVSKQLSLFPDPTVAELKQAIIDKLPKKGRPFKKGLHQAVPVNQVTLDLIQEVDRVIEGVHEVGEVVYKKLGFNNIFSNKKEQILLKDIVLARMAEPKSKSGCQQALAEKFGKKHNLDSIYRMMDKLHPLIDQIKTITFQATKKLFGDKVDLILFDVTTLYFESTNIDELRKFGYSKDHRFNTTQLVLALATNSDGLPIGYELFAGNKAEVGTLLEAINKWKTMFTIEDVCFIGDRAMFSKANLALLEASNYKYVIAAKLRTLPSSTLTNIMDDSNYKLQPMGSNLIWVGEFVHDKARLIVSYKKERALKDQAERTQVINKLKKVLGKEGGDTKKLINNQGVKKYTKIEQSNTNLDEDKITNEAMWDGLHGVITNIKNEPAVDIIGKYSRLWRIEESFRLNKHLLQMRPIYHYKPERIETHIAICYMAFTLIRQIEYRVSLTQKISPEKIIEHLKSVQSSIHMHKITRDLYKVPGKFSNEARKVYKTFDIKRELDAILIS